MLFFHVTVLYVCCGLLSAFGPLRLYTSTSDWRPTPSKLSQQPLLMPGMAVVTTVCGCCSLLWADCQWPAQIATLIRDTGLRAARGHNIGSIDRSKSRAAIPSSNMTAHKLPPCQYQY